MALDCYFELAVPFLDAVMDGGERAVLRIINILLCMKHFSFLKLLNILRGPHPRSLLQKAAPEWAAL